MTFIQSIVANGSAGTLSFTSIPQNFTHLQLRFFARVNGTAGGNTNSNVFIRFNSDSGNNYTRHLLYDQGGINSYGAGGTSAAFASAAPTSNNTSGIYLNSIVDILDYTNTNKNKVTRCIGGYDNNGVWGNRLNLESGLWINTAAITRLDIIADNSETYTNLTRADLYGITTSELTGA